MRASLGLLGLYVGVAVVLQTVGVVVSQLFALVSPTASVFVFLMMYFTMFWIAWPIALRLSYHFVPETDEERALQQPRPVAAARGRSAGSEQRLSPARATAG